MKPPAVSQNIFKSRQTRVRENHPARANEYAVTRLNPFFFVPGKGCAFHAIIAASLRPTSLPQDSSLLGLLAPAFAGQAHLSNQPAPNWPATLAKTHGRAAERAGL